MNIQEGDCEYMKKQIRRGVFETNSSSVHSLTICDSETFKRWKDGELLFDKWTEKFINPIPELSDFQKEDAKEYYVEEMKTYWKEWNELSSEEKEKWYHQYALEHDLISEDAKTYDDYFDDDYFETYEKEYTTKSGDHIVCFGYYGHD